MTGTLITNLQYVDLPKRGLTEESCRKWGYGIGEYAGRPVQVACYRNEANEVVAQKLRSPDKSFIVLGDMKRAGLYGQHLWRDGGNMVVVVEGEIDALSMSQIQQHKWPVVSVPSGAGGAKKAIHKSLEWLERFNTVVFMLDNDDAGQKAALECAAELSPGKAKIATLPLKDCNEMLVAGRGAECVSAMWNAKTYRPDGILGGDEVWALLMKEDDVSSVAYPWAGLNEKTMGMRGSEIVTLCAGSGIGKSQVAKEIAHFNALNGDTIGYIGLEECVKRTTLSMLSLALNRPLHLGARPTAEELKPAFDQLIGSGRMYFYDHFGSLESDNLLAKVRYMARALGCKTIVLDHISIVVSGLEDGDERRNIDNVMTKLRSLVQETGVRLLLISHLKRPDGKGHEDGAQTSMSQLRGSAAIGQLSDIVIGLERDQQDEENRHVTTVRVLKNRFSGDTGVACALHYSKETGRMTEGDFAVPPALEDDDPKNKDF